MPDETPAAFDALRPERLEEFAGQHDVTAELRIVLGAAAARDELPDHLLFAGPPGLGKTTLAHIVADECRCGFLATSGPALDKPAQLMSLLSTMSGPTVVFIDEIHRLPRAVEELLYPAMEDGVLDVVVGQGPAARPVRLALQRFVLVGATTQVGTLGGPLRDRFGYVGRLRLYEPGTLTQIVLRSAGLLGVDIEQAAAAEIGARSRGTPRVANQLLRRVRDYAQTTAAQSVDLACARRALEAFGVDNAGLDRVSRQVLDALVNTFCGGPVGLSTLAATVGEAQVTIEEVCEPHLLREGLIMRTPRGRVATVAAFEHLGATPPPPTATLFDAIAG